MKYLLLLSMMILVGCAAKTSNIVMSTTESLTKSQIEYLISLETKITSHINLKDTTDPCQILLNFKLSPEGKLLTVTTDEKASATTCGTERIVAIIKAAKRAGPFGVVPQDIIEVNPALTFKLPIGFIMSSHDRYSPTKFNIE